MLFVRMVHALPLRPFLPTSVLLSQPMHLVAATFSHVGITMQLFGAKTGSGIFYDGLRAVDVRISFASPVDHITLKILSHVIFINEEFLSEL